MLFKVGNVQNVTLALLLLTRIVDATSKSFLDSGRHSWSFGWFSSSQTNGDVYAASPETCAPLSNKGTHFTVDTVVGTPFPGDEAHQVFSVVADTGSNALIVPSCLCENCDKKESKCFTGTNKSSTFSVEEGPNGEGPMEMMITFGSGPIDGVIAKDVVTVGNLTVNMTKGILLMVGQQLNFEGAFEGILGLGLPGAGKAADEQMEAMKAEKEAAGGGAGSAGGGAASIEDIIKAMGGAGGSGGGEGGGVSIEDILGGGGGGGASSQAAPMTVVRTPLSIHGMSSISTLQPSSKKATSFMQTSNKFPFPSATPAPAPPARGEVAPMNITEPIGFLEEAGIGHFSMCFNEATSGVLRLGGEQPTTQHGSIGTLHWGLGLHGISVGSDSVAGAVAICDPANLTEGQETACGMIPDSGTTLIMAPSAHLEVLFEALCNGWERCANNYSALVNATKLAKQAMVSDYGIDPFGLEPNFKKSEVFKILLQDCDSWLHESEQGLLELPPLRFHIGGADKNGVAGPEQLLELSGWAYVIESMQEEEVIVYEDVPGVGKIPISRNKTGVTRKVCAAAMDSMPGGYNTMKNGPVYIVGTPLFYEYTVGYNLKAEPPSMAFTSVQDKPCGSCNGVTGSSSNSTSSAAMGQMNARSRRGKAWRPRQIGGKPRMPRIDTRLPL